jgi:hypothetical protein
MSRLALIVRNIPVGVASYAAISVVMSSAPNSRWKASTTNLGVISLGFVAIWANFVASNCAAKAYAA